MGPRGRVVAVFASLLLACEARRVPPAAVVRPAATSEAEAPTAASQLENLRAFTRLYGYVRWFHPSDEAVAVDWTAMAVLGAGVVRDATDAGALQAALTRLFAPVAPTLRIYREGEPPPALSRLTPASAAGLETVAWQHLGLGGGLMQSVYFSKRTGRTIELAGPGPGFATLTSSVDAAPLRGRTVRLRGSARATPRDEDAGARLWLRVERPDGLRGFVDEMKDRRIRDAAWAEYEVVGEVAADATRVTFGAAIDGRGAAAFDDFSLAAEDADGGLTPVTLVNPGFEAGAAGWSAATDGYHEALVAEPTRGGSMAAELRSQSELRGSGPLFAATPAVGEAIDAPIGRGLRVQVPLALHARDGRTLGGDARAFAELRALLAADRVRRPQAYASLEHPDLRAAAVVVAWNVLQHFYPYFDVVAVDWAAALDEALTASVRASDAEAFRGALARMIAGLDDGHANLIAPASRAGIGWLPLRFEWIEEALVVVASATPELTRGDVVATIDGVPVAQRLAEEERRISGSPQWRRVRAMDRLAQGPRGEAVTLTLQRGPATLRYSADATPEEPAGPQIRREADGVYVVDLGRASWPAIAAELANLARAPGVVFDLRGYPNSNDELLSHLLAAADMTKGWMRVPQIVRPDHVAPTFAEFAWTKPTARPRIAGKVAFLSGPGAISYAESVLAYVAHYRLGEIVGAATAGANGNINMFEIPGDMRVVFTGMKVLHHDGGQHHVVGISPTVPAGRTIAGVRAGRDEVLERGLAVVRGG